MEREAGFEPATPDYTVRILPSDNTAILLNYSRINQVYPKNFSETPYQNLAAPCFVAMQVFVNDMSLPTIYYTD